MVRPGREALSGIGEVDETDVGGLAEGKRGRGAEHKTVVVIAAEEAGEGIGRIRMARIAEASATSLYGFLRSAVTPGSRVHPDGWDGYAGVSALGYEHEVRRLRGQSKSASTTPLPRVHRVASLLKRWLLWARIREPSDRTIWMPPWMN